MTEKQTILFVLGQGGHTKQMLRLAEMLGEKYNYEYILSRDDNLSENKIKKKGRIFKITNPRKMTDKSLFKVFLRSIPSSIQTVGVLMKSKSKIIIGCGPALSIPVSLIGRLTGKKIVFLESWSRVYSKSISGRIIAPLAALFFIQWPEQQKNYPKAVYAGRLG